MKKPNSKMGAPRKSDEKRKGRYMQVRLTDAEKHAFDRAADIAGIPMSAWVRERLRMAARAELEERGEKTAFDLEL